MRYILEDNNIRNIYSRYILNKNPFITEKVKRFNEKMNPELFKKFDKKITLALHYMSVYQTYYYNIVMGLKILPTLDVKTMAVNAFGNLYINPDFVVNTLTDDGVVAVLAHEAGHVEYLSFFRMEDRDIELWNVATDYVINKWLLKDGFALPNSDKFRALLPEKINNRWIIPHYNNLDITNMKAERLYWELEKWEEKDPEQVKKDKKTSQEFGDNPTTPGGQYGPTGPGGKKGEEGNDKPEDGPTGPGGKKGEEGNDKPEDGPTGPGGKKGEEGNDKPEDGPTGPGGKKGEEGNDKPEDGPTGPGRKGEKGGESSLKKGNVIWDNRNNTHGIVTNIDPVTGKVDFDPIRDEDVNKYTTHK